MNVDYYGISDIGLKRTNNEDAWGELSQHHFYVLADGMGGHQAGEIASRETVESLLRAIPTLFRKKRELQPEEFQEEIKEVILETNSWIYHLAQENSDMHGMGTTLCCLTLYQNQAICIHVGDSRIYRFRDQECELLTQDHSLRKELAKRYHMDEESGLGLPSKHVITRAIGTSAHVEPEINSFEINAGDTYFLCSDGLSDVVSEDEMTVILNKATSAEEASASLVELALNHGGQDNITVVMVKVNTL